MIDPQQCASRVLRDNPEVADALYDLLIWMKNARGALAEAEADKTLEIIYSKTTDGGKHRENYDKRRLGLISEKKMTIKPLVASASLQ